jgi:hypothetical protein
MSSTKASVSVNPLWAGLTAAGILAGTLVFAYTPLHGPTCLFKAAFHCPCPGCGITRSLMALWHADPAMSFRYHPLGIPLFIGCAAFFLTACLRTRVSLAERVSQVLCRAVLHPRILSGFAVLFLLVWVIRLSFVASGSRFFLWQ